MLVKFFLANRAVNRQQKAQIGSKQDQVRERVVVNGGVKLSLFLLPIATH